QSHAVFGWRILCSLDLELRCRYSVSSARSVDRKFIAERFSARSSRQLGCLLSRCSATKSSTSCGRCRPQLALRELGQRGLIFYYWIKVENLSALAIYFPTQKGLR